MKKKLMLLGIGLGALAISTPIIITMTSCSKNSNESANLDSQKSIWNLDNDKKTIYLKNQNLGSNLDDIRVYNVSNNELIEFNKEKSVISESQIFINFDDGILLPDQIKIQNNNTSEFVIITNEDNKTFKEYDLIKDQEYFFNLIKDMSSNNMPTIGILRAASLNIQEAFYISLVNYFNNYNLSDSKDATFMFGQSWIWDEKRFNEEALKNANIWNGNKDENKVDLYSNFNIFVNDTNWNNTNDMISSFNKILKNVDSNYFDFFHDEIEFMKKLDNFDKNFFKYVFTHSNRVILLSDGAYHTATNVPKLENLLQNHQPKPREEIIKKLNNLRTNANTDLSKDDVLDILLLKNYEANKIDSNFNYVSFINYDSNIFNSSSLNDKNYFNDSAFSTNFLDYKKCINDDADKTKFVDIYSKLFITGDLSKEQIFINGIDSYDPNKRNAIFIGSSLFRPFDGSVDPDDYTRLTDMPEVTKEIQKTFNYFLEKFNPDEYNIIFKLHPVYSNTSDPNNIAAINYVNLITNKKITNPIIVSSNIPLETWISLDYYNFLNNKDSIIFKSAKGFSAKEWTTFFGLQATTTTIHTTRLFYQSAFNITKEEAAQLIPFTNFPIPKLFPIVDRLSTDNSTKDYTQANLEKFYSIYRPFCPSIKYPAINEINDLSKYDSIVLNVSFANDIK